MVVQRCVFRFSVFFFFFVDEVYEFILKSSYVGSDGSEGFYSEEDIDVDYEDDFFGDSGYALQVCVDIFDKRQLGKKMRKQLCFEIDEEFKEVVGFLFYLVGIRICFGFLISIVKI